MENGQYRNHKFGKTGKTCSAMHPGEHKHGFCIRRGLKYDDTKSSSVSVSVRVPVEKNIVHTIISVPCDLDKEIKEDTKEISTKPSWSALVYNSLEEDEKTKIYGKGLEMITRQGYIDGLGLGRQLKGSIDPISLSSSVRMPWQTEGLGFVNNPTISVTATGFNWVKGCVLQPEKIQRSRKTRWDVKPAFMIAVDNLNRIIRNRIDSKNSLEASVTKAKAKAVEINNRLENLYITTVVDKAKAKAVEINNRIEEDSWCKVSMKKTTKSPNIKIVNNNVAVFRVHKKDVQLAILAINRSGISNYKLEYID